MDLISHQDKIIVDKIGDKIINFEDDYPHSILIYGSKSKAVLT
jgi:hypothetical protein